MKDAAWKRDVISHRTVIHLAEQLGYPKLQSLKTVAAKLGHTALDKRCEDLLTKAARTDHAVFFYPGMTYEISPFGANWSAFSLIDNPHRLSPDNAICFGAELSEAFLRRLFTGLELLLFKSCHIALESQRRDYDLDSEGAFKRFVRLLPVLQTPARGRLLEEFKAVTVVRNAFAHSFVRIERLPYRGVPLEECFYEPPLGPAATGALRSFICGAVRLVSPLLGFFVRHQVEQVDPRKFGKLVDRLLWSANSAAR